MYLQIKMGIKCFALCCAVTGYLNGFEIYTGKGNGNSNLPTEVVMRLLGASNVAKAENPHRVLYTDNWYVRIREHCPIF
jgi:hypothetical protein